jgi:hypothetical protein
VPHTSRLCSCGRLCPAAWRIHGVVCHVCDQCDERLWVVQAILIRVAYIAQSSDCMRHPDTARVTRHPTTTITNHGTGPDLRFADLSSSGRESVNPRALIAVDRQTATSVADTFRTGRRSGETAPTLSFIPIGWDRGRKHHRLARGC